MTGSVVGDLVSLRLGFRLVSGARFEVEGRGVRGLGLGFVDYGAG